MKIISVFNEFLQRQLSLSSSRRIVLTVALLVCGFWLTKTAYQEWQITRLVTVMTQQLQQLWQKPQPSPRQPADINDSRA